MQKIFDFLTELSHNNNREWFNAHKEQYVACHERFVEWNAQLLEKLAVMDPTLAHLTPKDCIWRIYRDVRFSKDKRPYKEWFGTFPAIGGKKGLYAGYYVHIQPDNCLFAGGMWCPPSNLVKKIQSRFINKMYTIEENGFMEWLSIVMNRNKSKISMSQADKEIVDAWAEFAVSINADKLYESAE
jgi:uncharacterized protein (TIGR02453 family)